MKGLSGINAGGAEETPASTGFSALSWPLADDLLGDLVNSGEKSFQEELGDLLVTWEMDYAGTQRQLQLSSTFQLLQAAISRAV